jgi:2'-5' RNA ligase
MSELRSFVAVPLPSEMQSRIFAAAQELAPGLPGMKWSRKAENLHVTLKFLGQVAEERLDALGVALAESLGPVPSFPVELRRMGAFPSARHAKVVWAWVDDGDGGRKLRAVVEVVEETAVRLGLPREQRLFSAHVTVGRAKHGGVDARRALDVFADREFGDMTVGEVHLYESRLGGEGSTYVLRARAPLGN